MIPSPTPFDHENPSLSLPLLFSLSPPVLQRSPAPVSMPPDDCVKREGECVHLARLLSFLQKEKVPGWAGGVLIFNPEIWSWAAALKTPGVLANGAGDPKGPFSKRMCLLTIQPDRSPAGSDLS